MKKVDLNHYYLYFELGILGLLVYLPFWPLAAMVFIICLRQTIVCALLSFHEILKQE